MLDLGINTIAEDRIWAGDWAARIFQIGLLAACKDLPRHVSQPFQGVQCAAVRSSHFPALRTALARHHPSSKRRYSVQSRLEGIFAGAASIICIDPAPTTFSPGSLGNCKNARLVTAVRHLKSAAPCAVGGLTPRLPRGLQRGSTAGEGHGQG